MNTQTQSSLDACFAASARLAHRFRALEGEMHGSDTLSAGRRGILRDLREHGPQTVPQMARRRSVSRQHIQALVDPLLSEGHLELIENPAHRRSRLVRLTRRGERLVEEMAQCERDRMARLALPISQRELDYTASVLQALCDWLGNVGRQGDFPPQRPRVQRRD
ncbi:MarR family transcriptional regulator [Candidatus Sumerlaeota bacterium]|nr:MarR family transcriptional regulator [Candidatus Sumerlaeota bacterium]